MYLLLVFIFLLLIRSIPTSNNTTTTNAAKSKIEYERLLVKAIKSENVTVNLTVNKSKYIKEDKNGNPTTRGEETRGGSFLRTTLDVCDDKGEVIATTGYNYVSTDALDENFDSDDHGSVIIHEATEGYRSGRISMRKGKEADMPNDNKTSRRIYWRSHKRASEAPYSKKDKQVLRERGELQ